MPGGEVFGFQAQWGAYTDTTTGLVLLTHRYYDPQNGRFLTRDPIGYPGGINLYAYCGNNPVNFSDPLGLCGGGGGDGTPRGLLSWLIGTLFGPGWQANPGLVFDFVFDQGSPDRGYAADDPQTSELADSPAMRNILQQYIDNDRKSDQYSVGTLDAFVYTSEDFGNGTVAQLGAFDAALTNNGNGTTTIRVTNQITADSALGHYSSTFRLDTNPFSALSVVMPDPSYAFHERGDGSGMGKMQQQFEWTIPTP